MNNKPFLLKPAAKDYLWGGNRLNEVFGKQINMFPLAETWECSTHPDGQSIVASGEFYGKKLSDVINDHPEFLGTHAVSVANGQFPILIKLIDADKDLSVQVHPDDEYAIANENSLGKAEMWYVLDAKPGSELTIGFNQDLTRERVEDALLNGTIAKYLNHIVIQKNDVFFIEPGTVHAIGAGSLIAEIQESSNITYRLYDYDRIDKNGSKRELHTDKALDVINLRSSASPRQPMRVLRYRNSSASELLTRCKYFQVERMLVNTECEQCNIEYQTDSNSFHVLLCVEGRGMIFADDAFGNDSSISFAKGDCVFIPADSIKLKIHGNTQLLNISC